MKRAASEFLRAVRGRRSQVAFARRLGYRSNPITDWENGRRYPTAQEALRACERVGIDVAAAFARFHPRAALERDEAGFRVGPWLDRLRGTASINQVAQRSGRSRFAIARVLSEQSSPRLPVFFELVEAITARLPDLVAELVPIEEISTLRQRYAAARAARTIAFTEPWTEAVLRVLETPAYGARPHSAGYVAQRLGVPAEVVERCLAMLQGAGVVRREAERYVPSGELTVDTRGDPGRTHRLRTHWARVNLARADEPRPGDGFAYNLMSVSSDDLDRIRELLRATFREIRSIVAASEPTESVALLTIQVTQFDDG